MSTTLAQRVRNFANDKWHTDQLCDIDTQIRLRVAQLLGHIDGLKSLSLADSLVPEAIHSYALDPLFTYTVELVLQAGLVVVDSQLINNMAKVRKVEIVQSVAPR